MRHLPTLLLLACSSQPAETPLLGALAPFSEGLSRHQATCTAVPRSIARFDGLEEATQCWDSLSLATFVLTQGDTIWSIERTTLATPAETTAVLEGALRALSERMGPPERCNARLWVWRARPDFYGVVIFRPASDAPGNGARPRYAVVRYVHLGNAPRMKACLDSTGTVAQ